MNFFKRLFGSKKPGPPDKKTNGKCDTSMFCNPEEQKRRDEEVEAVKKKSEESHRDLTETIEEFNHKAKETHGTLQAPKA